LASIRRLAPSTSGMFRQEFILLLR
jgi:hypothetical protein